MYFLVVSLLLVLPIGVILASFLLVNFQLVGYFSFFSITPSFLLVMLRDRKSELYKYLLLIFMILAMGAMFWHLVFWLSSLD